MYYLAFCIGMFAGGQCLASDHCVTGSVPLILTLQSYWPLQQLGLKLRHSASQPLLCAILHWSACWFLFGVYCVPYPRR